MKIRDIEIKNPVIMAPMAGITNMAFRKIVKEFGAGLVYSEMVSDKAICYGNQKTIEMLQVDEGEHPVSIQLFGGEVESMVQAAKFIDQHSNCDIIDINCGCPVNKVLKANAGSKLLQNPQLIYDIVSNIVKNVSKPVTVKIRSGFDKEHINAVEVAKLIEKAGASAIAVHGRTRSQMYEGKADWSIIKAVKEAVSIPVMAKARIGHFVEAQILEALEIDYIDESEVLSPADDTYHIDKTKFKVPFVCGARNLGEALRRIAEGASMIRTKGEAGTGDVIQAVRHMRTIQSEMRKIQSMREDELFNTAKELAVPYDLVKFVHENGKLPVVNFSAGGVATPADAALMMQLGAEGVFVGSGIFKSGNPEKRAAAIVKAVTNYNNPAVLAELSEDLGEAMVGINPDEIKVIMESR